MAYTIPANDVIDYPPAALYTFHVYTYEWIDNLHFILPPERFTGNAQAYVDIVKARFRESRWDGDGDIGILWLPPFVFPFVRKVSPQGLVLWHTKQVEDGISWLLSPIRLSFEQLGETAPESGEFKIEI